MDRYGKQFYLVITLFIILFSIFLLSYNNKDDTKKEDYEKTKHLKEFLVKKQNDRVANADKFRTIEKIKNDIEERRKKLEEKKKQEEQKRKQQEDEQWQTYEVTFYTAGYESTGKYPNHPEYRITASGKEVKVNHTVACPKELPFGTRLYIEKFGERVCEDRGGAIKGKRLDIYVESLDEAYRLGRQKLKVKIIN